jgi:3'-phosphoadenosine 5'-phosphosulfate sulfotransferase
MKLYFPVCFAVLISTASCEREEELSTKKYFNLEVDDRLKVIMQMPVVDSLKYKVNKVHQRVGELTLLSKDIENLRAAVHLSNSFFSEVASEYSLNPGDFTQLQMDMNADEIDAALRQNELNFLNQLILQNDSAGSFLFTAQ